MSRRIAAPTVQMDFEYDHMSRYSINVRSPAARAGASPLLTENARWLAPDTPQRRIKTSQRRIKTPQHAQRQVSAAPQASEP